MKVILTWVAVFAALSLSCCFQGNPEAKGEDSVLGWRTTGLIPNADELNEIGTGIQKVTHVGDYLFAMDAKRGAQGKKEFRIFTTQQGSTKWNALGLPNRVVPYSWIADSQYLYVGMDMTGQIWRFDPRTKAWKDLQCGGDTLYRVYGFGFYKGKLVASLASGWDTTKAPILMKGEDGLWKNINANQSFPVTAFHSAVEYNNALYVATYDKGVWYWNAGDSIWRKITDPPRWSGGTAINAFPRGIVVNEEQLYVSYWNAGGIQLYLGNDLWQRVDSMVQGVSGNLKTTTALHIYSLATWNGRLFSAGYLSSNPTVYTGPAEPKGWRKISRETYCPEGAWQCLGTNVSDMTVLNDTLYAAAWDALLKYPLSELEEGIKNAPAYPVVDSTK